MTGPVITAPDTATLSVASIGDYLRQHPELLAHVDLTELTVSEVGDGNLNQVFLCRGADGRTLVLKQALPYVRLVGPSWPMTEERATREAEAIAAHSALSQNVCRVLSFDHENHVLALEDLTDHTVLRTFLNAGNSIDGVPAILGRHVADTSYGTSFVAVGEEPLRIGAAAAVNSELCKLTEDVIFTEPFLGAERNSWRPCLDALVAKLQADPSWVAGAMAAKLRFVTAAEALLHGDLHTGSIFVRYDAGAADPWSVKTFDPEFAFYGPIGFDLGLFWANLILAAARADGVGEQDRRDALLRGVIEAWEAFASRFRELYATRPDPGRWTDAFLDSWLDGIAADARAFAACEITRRIIGLAKVSDIESLDDDAYQRATDRCLRYTRLLFAATGDGVVPDLAAHFAG